MNDILFINACLRCSSRTKRIADAVINNISKDVKEVALYKENIYPLNNDNLILRDMAASTNDYSSDYFRYAKDFRDASEIIIAAPYWDLSFPSILKVYFENICVVGVTFIYGEDGRPISLCKAKRLIYVTTAGGFIPNNNYGYDYVSAIAKEFFGIKDVICIKAEGLDINPNDANEIVNNVIKNIKSII